jgi:hypothetical protein
MKETWEWTEDDILSLIHNNVGESTTLEYKACDALDKTAGKKKEISKDVSAFANSAGGTIVYGVTENSAHEPEAIDSGFDPNDISGEWLEQIINSNIERRISGIIINTVALPKTHPGNVLYVVYIPESKLAPHMAADDRFYKRFNFQSVPMKEYEVRNLMRREHYPSREVVCAWRDTVINPLLSLLWSVGNYLEEKKWEWDRDKGGLQGLIYIGKRTYSSGNEEEFLELYPHIQMAIEEYDRCVEEVHARYKELFENITASNYVLDVYLKAISSESIQQLRVNFHDKLQHSATDEDVVKALFGGYSNLSREDHLKILSEYIITNRGKMSVMGGSTTAPLWNTYRDKFCIALDYPPLRDYKIKADEAREQLILNGTTLINELKKIRTDLARQHGVPVDTPVRDTQF